MVTIKLGYCIEDKEGQDSAQNVLTFFVAF